MAEKKYLERLKNTGRNDPCPCGSGKKYKKCHLQADEESRHNALVREAEKAAARAAEEEAEEKKEGQAHLPQAKGHKDTAPVPRTRPKAVARQISTPRKAGTS